jgi:hypothetical protein
MRTKWTCTGFDSVTDQWILVEFAWLGCGPHGVSSTGNNRVFRPLRSPATLDRMTATPAPLPVAQPAAPQVSLRSPADLVALAPYLLGFHPVDSVVVVGLRGRQIGFAARGDLPDPAGNGPPVSRHAREIIDLVARQSVDSVALLGYGPAAAADPMLRAVRAAADRSGLPVVEVLRVSDQRWWSQLCQDPRCCPPEGTPVDLAASEVSARCTYAGLTAAGSREDLARGIAPVGGSARAAMTEATDRAEQGLADLLATLPESEQTSAVLTAGSRAIEAAIARYAEGTTLDDDAVAWLGILLVSIPVRDVAWRAITTGEPHLRLWTDLTRRVEPALVPAPASLLAFTAWRAGDGALAGMALERALREDPSYSLANLLMDALQQGIPPSRLDGWPAPAQEGPEPRDQVTRWSPA